jgi:pyruvate formate lyase activating enzyme
MDTAKLAHENGLLNLYKSAFFITEKAIDDLLDCIDIFSISVKAINKEYYREITGGRLQPVLDGVKRVYEAGKHLEISNLMITDISDDEESAERMAEWMLTNLGSDTPLHFVRFHPAYKLIDTVHTPIHRLLKAREISINMGIKHVYLGNVYDSSVTSTYCRNCGDFLVRRFGLKTEIVGLNENGLCNNCGHHAYFKFNSTVRENVLTVNDLPELDFKIYSFDWNDDIFSFHVQVLNSGNRSVDVYYLYRNSDGSEYKWRIISLYPKESYRFIISKADEDETQIQIAIPPLVEFNLHEILDRAHYPTVPVSL